MHDFTKENLDESRVELDDESGEKAYQLKQEIFRLVERFASGELDEPNFQEEKKRFLKDMVKKGLDENRLGEGLLMTDNLLQIAQNVKAMVAHREATGNGGIDDIWKDTDVIIGTANVGARTEIYQSRTDRVVEKLEKRGKVSSLVDETVIGTAAVTALTVGAIALKQPIMAATAGAVGGVFAGVRANNMIKQARTLDARAAIVGKGGVEMFNESRYEAVAATDLMNEIGTLYDDDGVLKIADQENYQHVMGVLAEAEVRRNLSDSQKIDLISFSGLQNMEQERFDLDLALAKAKSDMRRLVNESSDEDLARWIKDDEQLRRILHSDDEFGFAFEGFCQSQEGILNKDMIQQKDRVFRKMKRRKVAKAVVIATVLSMTTAGVGAGTEEAAVAMSDSLSDSFTPPETTMEFSGETHTIELGEYTELKLPEEFEVEKEENGTLTIVGPEGMELTGLNLNDEGQLTAESRDLLQTAGIGIGTESSVIPETVSHDVEVNGKEFVENHEDLTTEITRDAWYDNGTEGVDGSELTLQAPERDSSGNVHIAISDLDMMASSPTGEEISLQDAAMNGDMKVAVTASGDTQANAFLFDVDVHVNADGEVEGEAIIPHDHPAASSLFDQNGEFQGAFIENVIENGVSDEGMTSVDVLATDVGPDVNNFSDTVSDLQHHKVDVYTLDFSSSTSDELGHGIGAFGGRSPIVPPVIPLPISSPARASRARARGQGETNGNSGRSPEVLVPLSTVEAEKQLEKVSLNKLYKAELHSHKGWLRSMGSPIGNDYVFARVDKNGKQLPGKPIFITVTKSQMLDRLREGRMKPE